MRAGLATFYDTYRREIQTQADNHLKGTDITWNEYNFAGELLFSKHEHRGLPDYGRAEPLVAYGAFERTATLYKSYTYDPRGRLLRTEQKMEDQENPGYETDFVSLSENRYDEIGQLGQKNLFYESGDQFLQLGNYQYNIRGWLSKFNDPSTTAIAGSYRDLLAFELNYNDGASAIVSTADDQFNGNISAMQWQVLGQGNEIRAYAFDYDNMNRLTEALYREKTSINWNVNTGRYDVKNLTYDKNGNIESLKRWGADTQADPYSFGQMDDLTYTYKKSGNSNQLAKVSDAVGGGVHVDVDQFFDGNSSGDDYDYDDSGNLLEDLNKDITSITYNHLNKPTEVLFSSGKKIKYIYTAAGTKLRQKVFATGTSSTTTETDYIGSVHYEDSDGDGTGSGVELQLISHGEGRMRRSGTELIYETYLKDHLGNNRVMFSDLNDDGWVDPNVANGEVLQIDHYYPFGMRMAGLSTTPAVPNSYLYNGKELQDELGLGWSDYEARMYDASIGRWNRVDAMAEERNWLTPYNYVQDNPIMRTDPDGNLDDDYQVDRDGNISLIRETEDDHDVLYATNEEGEVDEDKSVQVEKGILDDIKKGTTTRGVSYEYMKVNNDETSTKLFEFVAKNTNVEWSQVKYGTKSSFISTGHSPAREPGGSSRLVFLGENKFTVREHIHSHPSDNDPSGFSVDSQSSADRGFAMWVYMYRKAFPNIKLKVYKPESNEYVEYDNEKIIDK